MIILKPYFQGQSMRDYAAGLNRQKFTTKDSDNDVDGGNCAITRYGAWWFRSCTFSHLNGLYQTDDTQGPTTIHWKTWKNTTPLKRTEMKVKPVV